MVGCSAKYCTSATYKGFRLFRFPVDKKRRQLWIAICQRENWTPSESARLCNLHFTQDQFEQCRVDGWRRLKLNAIPTIFGGLTKRTTKKSKPLNRFYNLLPEGILPEHNYASITSPVLTEVSLRKGVEDFENNNEIKLEADGTTDLSIFTAKCAVASCFSNTTKCKSDLIYHQFPNDKEIKKQWIRACGGKETMNFANCYVCSIHFSEESFEKGVNVDPLKNKKWKLKVDAIPTLHLEASERHFEQNFSIKQEEFETIQIMDFEEQPLFSQDNVDYNTLKKQYERLKNNYIALQLLCRKQNQLIEQLENEICEVKNQTNV